MIKLNKKYYSLKLRVEKHKNGYFSLIEKNPKESYESSWSNDYLSGVHLIVGNLKYSMTIDNDSIEERLYGTAVYDESIARYSFSIFGTDRIINRINLDIYPSTSNKEGFKIYVSPKELYDNEVEEESLNISFYVNAKKFQSIKSSAINKDSFGNSTKDIQCFFSHQLGYFDNKKNIKIDGLYQTPHHETENHYKFLLDSTQIINKAELPSTFKVYNPSHFHKFPFKFRIEEKSKPTIDEFELERLQKKDEEETEKAKEKYNLQLQQYFYIEEIYRYIKRIDQEHILLITTLLKTSNRIGWILIIILLIGFFV